MEVAEVVGAGVVVMETVVVAGAGVVSVEVAGAGVEVVVVVGPGVVVEVVSRATFTMQFPLPSDMYPMSHE